MKSYEVAFHKNVHLCIVHLMIGSTKRFLWYTDYQTCKGVNENETNEKTKKTTANLISCIFYWKLRF